MKGAGGGKKNEKKGAGKGKGECWNCKLPGHGWQNCDKPLTPELAAIRQREQQKGGRGWFGTGRMGLFGIGFLGLIGLTMIPTEGNSLVLPDVKYCPNEGFLDLSIDEAVIGLVNKLYITSRPATGSSTSRRG